MKLSLKVVSICFEKKNLTCDCSHYKRTMWSLSGGGKKLDFGLQAEPGSVGESRNCFEARTLLSHGSRLLEGRCGGREEEQRRQRKHVCVGLSRSGVRALRSLSPPFYLRGHWINIKSGSEYIVCFHAVRMCESAQKTLRRAGASCGRRVIGSRASPAFRPHHSHFTPYWSRRAARARQNKSKRG